jgi:hypothetical protein
MKIITSLLLALLLVGCQLPDAVFKTHNHRLTDEEVARIVNMVKEDGNKNEVFMMELKAPPDISDYENLLSNERVLRKYSDHLNLYFEQVFAYTATFNLYAKERGWKPPEHPPVCRILDIDTLDELPPFENVGESKDLNWQLADYIKRLKVFYGQESNEQEVTKIFQRFLCVY